MTSRSPLDRPPILFVGNFLDIRTGTRAVSEDLSIHLAADGWPVLLTSRKRDRVARMIDMLRAVWTNRNSFRVAVIDVYSGPAFRFAEIVARMVRWLDKPYVLVLHGGNLPAFSARRAERVRNLLDHAASVTTPSRYLLETMSGYCDKLRLIPNPITLAAYPVRMPGPARPRLVWLRAFHRIYNPAMAVEAVKFLIREFPEIHLTMIGPDKNDGTLAAVRGLVRRLSLEEHVEIAGPVAKSEVPARLAEADIFLNTTNVDNTPVSVLEAMACGLCVVTTNVGGIPYIVQDGADALLVRRDSPFEMADAIRNILNDEWLARSLSKNARRRVMAFDWSRVLPEWEQLLARVEVAS